MKFFNIKKAILNSMILGMSGLILFYQMPGFAQELQLNSSKGMSQDFSNLLNVSSKEKLRLKLDEVKKQNLDNKVLKLKTEFNAFPAKSIVDVTLRDIDVASTLRILAKEGGKNIVLDKSVQGVVNAELKNVSLNEAMQIILNSEELEARVEGNTIFVASRPAMAKKGLNRKYIKAFKLNNSNAVDVAKIIEASIFNKGYAVNDTPAQGAQTAAASQPSTPVATQPVSQAQGTASANAGMQQAVNTTSQETSTGQSTLIASKTVRGKIEILTPGDTFNDSSKPASAIKLQAVTSSIGDVTVNNNDGGPIAIPDTRTNTVLIAGLQEDINLAQDAIAYLDKALPQVSIEVSLIELKKDDSDNFGLALEGQSNKFSSGFNSPVSDPTTFANISEIGVSTVQTLSNAITARLKMLISNQKAKLLANPTILALDNSESLIKITDRIVSSLQVTVSQTSVTYTPILEDVGIVLNILPKVGSNGYVTMRIRPSITSPLEKVTIGNQGDFVTLVSTREVLLQDVRVKAGETLAIGGLIKESELEKLGKVPYIGDLPIFGKLFKNKDFSREKNELVILITPKIIEDVATN